MVAFLHFISFDSLAYCFCFSAPPPSPSTDTHTHDPPTNFFYFQIWILCQNSLTRELKITTVGFVLKKVIYIFRNVECTTGSALVDSCFLYFTSFSTVWHTVLVSLPLIHSPATQKIRFRFFVKTHLLESLKIRVAGFVLKKLLTYFEMLIIYPFICLYVRLFGCWETQELQLQTKVLMN